MNKLRCYVCGAKLERRFWLVSQGTDVDRVFVMDDDCVKRADRPETKIRVERINATVR